MPSPKVMLAKTYNDEDPSGWLLSEKLDGYRAIWTGDKFLTRNHNEIICPDWFKEGLPSERLDGELFGGRGRFDFTSHVCGKEFRGDPAHNQEWGQILYCVFDAPDVDDYFPTRLKAAGELVEFAKRAECLDHFECENSAHLEKYLNIVTEAGGEGVMLRHPKGKYEIRRSKRLLKLKIPDELDCKVIGFKSGKDLGSWECEADDGTVFHCGVKAPHTALAPGTWITIFHDGWTGKKKPRFPRFNCVRTDLES